MSEIKQQSKQSKRGGRREGAGRKAKARDRIARDAAKERAVAVHQAVLARVTPTGEKVDPVEAIMETAEWALMQWREFVNQSRFDDAIKAGAVAVDWCAKAAPYIRPRLAAIEAHINVNVSIFERIERARGRLAIAA